MAKLNRLHMGAVSILELMCCLVIVSVLISLVSPMVSRELREAARTRSEYKLRDLARAVELYRADHGESGGPSQLGLPLVEWFVEDYGLHVPEAFQTGGQLRYYGGKHLEPGMFTRMYPTPIDEAASTRYGGEASWLALQSGWAQHIDKTGGTVALFEDETICSLEDIKSTFFPKPLSAVFLDGHVKRRTVVGKLPVWRFELWNN